jgi:diacylglycerol kinase family enzyme
VRALLVVNPAATTASPRTREVLLAALEGELKLEIVETTHRSHATELGRQARRDGLELVIALGGDGTVNEVVNGLLEQGPHDDVPDLAVVPGGGTNVFARALGIPRDPVEATGALLSALRERRRRSVGLGQVDQRWFTFNAGLGWDADVVTAVDRRRHEAAESPGPARSRASDYFRAAVRSFFIDTDRRHPALTVTFTDLPALSDDGSGGSIDGADGGDGGDGGDGADGGARAVAESAELTGLHMVMVANTAPWTYLGARPIGPFPRASFDHGLDLYGLRTLRTISTLHQVRQVVSRRDKEPGGRAAVHRHDLGGFRVTAARPVALQVDGEPLGERSEVVFRSVPDALRVVC